MSPRPGPQPHPTPVPHKERVTSPQCLQHVPPCRAGRRFGPPRGPPPASWPSAPSTKGPRELSVLWSLSLLRGIQNAAPGGGGSLAGLPGRTQDACEQWPGAGPGPHRGHAGARGLTQPRIHLLTKTGREEPPRRSIHHQARAALLETTRALRNRSRFRCFRGGARAEAPPGLRGDQCQCVACAGF